MTQTTTSARTGPLDAARVPAEIPLPCRLGAWRLLRLVAEGNLSWVYQAEPASASGDRTAVYAVKLLRPCWHDAPQAVACFAREAVLGRSISHPHLITVLAAHVSGPPYYLVMPWLAGTTLAARIERHKRLPLAEALWIARQMAEALGALHRDGWMHGDVKPGNIFVSRQDHATLLDLGFASRPGESLHVAERSRLIDADEREESVVGTPQYMAPETISSVWGADIRSDLYSLGVVLYQMLSGQLPFPETDLGELVRAHRQAWTMLLRRVAPHVPKEVARLVHQLLAKDPLRRPQTPAELIDLLVRLEIDALAER